MSVLSFSDIQYIGEQSPGTKPVEDILEEPTLLKVECPQQEAEDKLSLAILDKKQILSEVDYVRHVPGNDQSNDNHGETDTTREPNYAPQRPIGEPHIGIHSVEKALPKVDFSQHWQGDEKLNNNHEGSTSFPKTDSLNLVVDNLSNVEEEIYKEELGHLRIAEMHSFACSQDNEKGSCLGEEQGVHVIDRLFESNNCALPNEDDQSHETNRKESVDSPCNGHTILNKGNCIGEERVHAIDSLFESNHSVPPKEDGHRYQINKGKEHVDSPRNADCILSNTSNFRVQDGYRASILHKLSDLACRADFELGNLPAQVEKNKHLSASGNSHQLLEIMQHAGRDNNQVGESGLPGTEYLEQDHTVALWVKWRGKWQTGIRCSRADCPLPTLRAKPTHERKKYIAVYFPRTRTYSWADMLLVCSIDESPEPLVYGTHRRWRKWVKDLSVARRYIMQKLAVAMLNISDQLHTEAVIENARKATTWKEFAKEASCCRDYSDLGRILLKLQTMILPWYISHDWLENSFGSWVQRCQIAQSAESIEILTEELVESVLWTEVDELWNAPVQPELGTEWKTWKQEAMKWFFTSHPTANCGDVEHKNSDNSMAGGSQVSRKRPKLEVRRAETCASQMEASSSRVLSEPNYADANSGYFNFQGILESASSCDPKFIRSPAVGTSAGGGSGKTAIMVNAHRELDTTNKSRQCSAFIEAKGRQCGRWANDGDIYCCVHLNTRTVGKPSQEEQMLPLESPMCEGMTTHGNKCKHRARYGSQFCKKHRLQRSHDSINTDNFLISSGNKLKRKHEEDKIWENKSCSNTVDGQELRLVEVQNLIPIMAGETLDKRNPLMKKSELHNTFPSPLEGSCPDSPCCIGNYSRSNSEKCLENAKRHTLYCEKHLPKFLKRARNGKSRLVSKDVFIYLLRNCYSRKQKLHLHQACELLYGFMKSNLSGQKPVSKGDIMDWILSEASKDLSVGEYLLKLVSSEREKITRLWGFDKHIDMQTAFSETNAVSMLEKCEEDHVPEMIVKCKICNEGFCDDQKLGAHWTEFHKKEGRWLFRGYACAVCMNSFTNRKVLEAHVKDRHGVQFLEHSILFRCMSCNSHFVNLEQLWKHVLSFHLMEFRMQNVSQQHNHTIEQPVQPKLELGNRPCQNNDGSEDSSQRYICRLCGLKFDLLPDLGRHHQVAHMNPVSVSHFPPKRGDHRLKRSRHCHPGFKKSFSTAFRFKNQSSFGMRTHFQSSNSLFSVRPGLQTQASETVALGSLLESHCSEVAETLFSEIQKTKPRPSNLEILSIARSACCRISLSAALVVKYGILPENLYLKAAKLCSELNIQVDWHVEGFICPKGCRPLTHPHSLDPLNPLPDEFVGPLATPIINDSKWDMDECHYILQPDHFNWKLRQKTILLCEDVSFGKESVPVACVLDEDFKKASDNQELGRPMPWQGFTYVTERLIGQSHGLDTKYSQLGCACPHPKCYPENCDHVYLFDNDYENAVDIHGKSMRGRFPYDERGRIVLEEGHLVYECNSTCNCDSTCHNRVLQKGVQVKLEIFSTEKKGWSVRAGEAITRGTFVCEYLGEVLNDVEANRKGESYLYDIDAHIDGARGWSEGAIPYVIDATKYGNVSRFINHSCSPNLVNYLVLVESMDCQLAHIGLYASRDIAAGEELAYDYCHKLLPGDGHPCHCGAPSCRGRLY